MAAILLRMAGLDALVPLRDGGSAFAPPTIALQ